MNQFCYVQILWVQKNTVYLILYGAFERVSKEWNEGEGVETIPDNLKRAVKNTRRGMQVCLEYHGSWYVQKVLAWNCGSVKMGEGEFEEEYQTTWPASWETCMQVKKQQLEPDVEKQTGSKLRKEYVKAVCCHPAYSTYMQSTSWEIWAGWSTSWNQDCREKYQ